MTDDKAAPATPAALLDELDLGDSASPNPPRSDTLERQPALRIQGPVPVESYVAYERDLTEADLAALSQPRGTAPRSLVRIHSSHHALARCLAMGMKHTQAALVTGYSAPRISQLVGDPAFVALVEDYRAEAKSVAADMFERMSSFSLDAIEMLHERLHEKPQEFTIPVLLDLVKAFADRTGHGPGQEVTLRVDNDHIDRPPRESYEDWMKRRSTELKPEGETEEAPTQAPPMPLKMLN